jgi:hypothetical protein
MTRIFRVQLGYTSRFNLSTWLGHRLGPAGRGGQPIMIIESIFQLGWNTSRFNLSTRFQLEVGLRHRDQPEPIQSFNRDSVGTVNGTRADSIFQVQLAAAAAAVGPGTTADLIFQLGLDTSRLG